MAGGPQAQQAYWLFNGATGQQIGAYGGMVNAGAVTTTGAPISATSGLPGLWNTAQFSEINSYVGAAQNYALPGYQFGAYKNISLTNPGIFNFYKILLAGPTQSQMQNWNATDIDATETAFGDRLAVDLTYDRQKYTNSYQSLLGYNPTINLDINENFQYASTLGGDGVSSITNPNYLRPFVTGGPGSGSEVSTDRESDRAALFYEFRTSDVTSNSLLQKLLGTHRFNLVSSEEKYWTEDHSWQMYTNSQAWAGYWNATTGATDPISDRAPQFLSYLGGSVAGDTSPNNLHIPGIQSAIYPAATSQVYNFNPAPNGNGANLAAPWNVPANLDYQFSGIPSPVPGATTQLYQNSNPANLVGWSYFPDQLISSPNGSNPALWTIAQQQLQETISYAGNYQGYLLNNALVVTGGWRYDYVATKGATAPGVTTDRAELNLSPSVYQLPSTYPANQIFGSHTLSGGAVLHLNDLLPRDPLPFEISLSFDDSKNGQVTAVRKDIYGNPISNPSGATKEYGLILSTKDNRFTLRVAKYDTKVLNGSASGFSPSGLGGAIAAGLRWRNIFLYQLGAYTLDTANQASYRNTWTNAFPNDTPAQAVADEDTAITAWNNIQNLLAPTGFFQAWNFSPISPSSALVDRSTYLTNPSAYQPTFASVASYGATAPQNLTATADSDSKGVELELTANPLPNWRLMFNATKTVAEQSNIGGSGLNTLIAFMDKQIYNPDGTFAPAGELPEYGGADGVGNGYASFKQGYILAQLQSGIPVSELRKYAFNAVTNYTFDQGFMKGIGIGGSVRWQDRNIIGYPINSSGQDVLSQPFYGPRQCYFGLFGSYTFKMSRRIHLRTQLNVDNVGSRNGLIPVSIEPDGHTWAAVTEKPVEQWSWSNTIDF